MKKILFLGAFIAVYLSYCNPKTQQKAAEPVPSGDIVALEDAYHFFVIGDWGRNGDFNQKELADMMNKVGEVIEPEVILSTGDNFYPNGVASTRDYHWIDSYETVYDGHFLQCPWYVVLGNHDIRGNYQAQIEYTDVSRRWTMPAQYFVEDEQDGDLSIRFIMLDTNPLNDEYSEGKYSRYYTSQDTARQLKWLDSLLTHSTADWNIVVGHHPMYTGGKRAGRPNSVRDRLEPCLSRHGVKLYFAGHEHDLQHIKVPDMPTHHIVSGAGSEVRETGETEHTHFAVSDQGFFAASVTKDSILLQAINHEGEMLYKYSIKK